MARTIKADYDGTNLVTYFRGVLSDGEIARLRAQARRIKRRPGHVLYWETKQTEEKPEYRLCDTHDIRRKTRSKPLKQLIALMDDCVRYTNDRDFHFEVDYGPDLEGVCGNGFSILRYREGGHFAKHQDWGHWNNLSARRLTCLMQLSEPSDYDGGELVIQAAQPIVMPKEPGGMIVFPSFWYHQVLPITRGTRWAAIGWYTGRRPLL